jgi:chromosome segregation ATPase
MKRISLLIGLVALLTSCSTAELEQRISDLESKNNLLAAEAANKDSVLQAFDETFSAISRNLAMIRESEDAIRLESKDIELNVNQRDAIVSEIQDINALLQSNKDQIKKLTKSVEKYQGEVGKYKTLIASLEKQIADKDLEIEDLKKNLVAANFTIDILNKMNTELASEIQNKEVQIEEMTDADNVAYYVIGSFKELKEKGIAEKAGAILAGKKMKQDFNREDFIKIDKREVMDIKLSSDKVTLLSNHPADSYEFKGEGENYSLSITKVNEFWSATNYLVLQQK